MSACGTRLRPEPLVPNPRAREAALTISMLLTDTQLDLIADRVAERLQPSTPSPWLDTRGAAAHLACKPARIHDLVQLGGLHPRRDGRRLLFRRDDLDAYLGGSR